ncbi:MAG: molecular chaperone HtpG [Anaerolineae bacterium]|nr:molecular chaperone HtpG [Anaerolineae bacterium]
MSDAQTFSFQAEIKQLLDILIHSLYSDREIFLRELISNASDALNRVQFELLTNPNVLDSDSELYIEVKIDEEAKTITISDSGIGMTREDMVNNLGTIARSGAKQFIEAMKAGQNGSANAAEVIGQFGVGFYSAFMVADKVQVVSKSHIVDEPAYVWEATGDANYTIMPAERTTRGTDIILHIKEEDAEFLQNWRIKQIIRKHSDYIAFPIYVDGEENPTNQQTALWRQSPDEIEAEKYTDFYRAFTMDFNEPLHKIHMRADVPLQFYALLYIPSSGEQTMFSLRKEAGLKLYARKILIQEYCKDLLPEYLSFVHGVVDTEDLPLNVNRESVQANRVMATLKKTITGKVLSELKRMANKDRETYLKIYAEFGRLIKQGVVVSPADKTDIEPLLFFNSTHDDNPQSFHSLADYVERMKEAQDDIYYIIADDFASARRSPHLDAFRQRGIEVLYFTDPVDAAMLMGLTDYKGHKIRSVDESDIDLSNIGDIQTPDEEAPALEEDSFETLQTRFKTILGERVRDVRQSKATFNSPARLVSDETGNNRYAYRINRLLDKDYQLPVKILELNPRHGLLHNLTGLINNGQTALVDAVIEQVFETALLQDGIHPDPSAMANRLIMLMQAATGTPADALKFEDDPNN